MRTNVEESALLGQVFAQKINQAKGPSLVLIPLGGFSAYDSPKGPGTINLQGGQGSHSWFWPEADRAFYQALKENLDASRVRYHELSMHINEPSFAEMAVQELDKMINGQ
jgi:uncharacterized protein (UPF0261 family)